MGKGKHRSYPSENEDKSKQLRRKIKELENENTRLKKELQTLNVAFSKVSGYIKGNLDGISLEKVIKSARQEKTLVEIKAENMCPLCGAEKKHSKLPFGSMEICVDACGWREVINETIKTDIS